MSCAPTTRRPPCQAILAAMVDGKPLVTVGVDVVIDVTGDLVHVIVPIAKGDALLAHRLSFTPEQLGALMDELIEATELMGEGQPW